MSRAIHPCKHQRLLDQLADYRASRTSYLKQHESYLKQLKILHAILPKTPPCVQDLTTQFTNFRIREVTTIQAYKPITEFSASTIAKNHRDFFDLIALPSSQEGFTPNRGSPTELTIQILLNLNRMPIVNLSLEIQRKHGPIQTTVVKLN